MSFAFQPRSPRVPLDQPVTLDDGAQQVRCDVGNLSRTGVLVHPPPEVTLGRFVRVTLCLPDGCVELAAFQVREARERSRVGWGLRFIGWVAAAQARIDAYVEGLLKPGTAPRHLPTG